MNKGKVLVKKILIKISISTLGDTLCSTPTIRKVSQAYDIKVDVMSDRLDVLKNNPYVNNILEFTEDDVEGYDEVFETLNQWIKVNKNKNNSEFYDKPMEIKLSNFEARQLHAMGIGITLYPEEMHYDYIPDGQTKDSKKITKDFLVFHVTESWPSRTWAPEKWQRLVDLVKQNTDFKIVTVGKEHKEVVFNGDIIKFAPKLKNVDLDFCIRDDIDYPKNDNKNQLSNLWHVINNASALISVDSGPIHLAGTTDTHIIQLGSSIDYRLRAPYRKGSQKYKYDHIGGECKIFCASDLKYSVKEWGTINSRPYVPECLENYDDFYCHPTPEQVFFKITEVIKNE